MKNIRFRNDKKNYDASAKRKSIQIFSAIIAVVIVVLFAGSSWNMYQERQAAMALIAQRQGQETYGAYGTSGEAEEAGRNQITEDTKFEENQKVQVAETVTESGVTYERNPRIRTILFLGVDRQDEFPESYLPAYGFQADSIFLLIQDVTTKKVQILQIPRETMTKIRLYDLGGQFISWETRQLNLAFAYGNSPTKSCENVAAAVTELLEGIPVDDYMAITIGALPILNDQVGGVTVEIDDPVLEESNPAFIHGSLVTLDAALAQQFLRTRSMYGSGGAYSRMLRHRQYLEGWFQAAQKEAASDNSFGAKLMDGISPYMVTDMPKDRYLKLGLDIMQNQGFPSVDDILVIPGEVSRGTYFDELHCDENKLHEMILELFYRKKE